MNIIHLWIGLFCIKTWKLQRCNPEFVSNSSSKLDWKTKNWLFTSNIVHILAHRLFHFYLNFHINPYLWHCLSGIIVLSIFHFKSTHTCTKSPWVRLIVFCLHSLKQLTQCFGEKMYTSNMIFIHLSFKKTYWIHICEYWVENNRLWYLNMPVMVVTLVTEIESYNGATDCGSPGAWTEDHRSLVCLLRHT